MQPDIHIHIHNHHEGRSIMCDQLERIFSLLNKISMNQQELADQLTALADQLTALKEQSEKANAEIAAKLQTLENAIVEAGNVTPAVENALADLKSSVQKTDDFVPDAPAAPAADATAETAQV